VVEGREGRGDLLEELRDPGCLVVRGHHDGDIDHLTTVLDQRLAGAIIGGPAHPVLAVWALLRW
jgi:hypothetical protein